MNNPFRYGIAVDDPFFIDREEEIHDYSKWIKSGQNIIIYSPRRYGKTSLILKILKNLKEDGLRTVYIDFFKVNSRRRFAELYYSEILKQIPSWEKTLRKISSLTKTVRPVISLDNQGQPSISVRFESGNGENNLTEVFDLPQKLAEKRRWVVVFDEFQEINKLNGEAFEKELRASIIHHTNVSYVFMGSKMHMLLNMFTHTQRAFYQFGRLTELGKIPGPILISYLASKFSEGGIKFDQQIIGKLIEASEEIPHYVQYLASGAWEEAIENNLNLDNTTLDKAIEKIITNQNDYFMKQYEALTAHQQRVLLAVTEEKRNIFTAGFAEKYQLQPVSSTQRSIQKLCKEGILTKQADTYHFNDPFFKLWLLKRIC